MSKFIEFPFRFWQKHMYPEDWFVLYMLTLLSLFIFLLLSDWGKFCQ